MNELTTMIILGVTGAGGISIDSSKTSMEQCLVIREKMKEYSTKNLFLTKDRKIEVICIKENK